MAATEPDSGPRDPGLLLRARGLRVTPQRRAILGAFAGAPAEHLSADEIHAKASAVVPELSRGTVYATVAELTELGLLAAFGSADPVRYEANVEAHEHFRCRLCLRIFDIELPTVETARIHALGFAVERTSIAVEGICADCVGYDEGLRAGTRAALPDDVANLAHAAVDSPVGAVQIAATSAGVVRVAFEDRGDTQPRRRTGSAAARRHVAAAQTFVEDYFAGSASPSACVVDWPAVQTVSVSTLQAVQAIPAGVDRSYETLRSDADARTRGYALGANPLVLVVPCHRVSRGREITEAYIGGAERKHALRRHER